MRMTLQQLIDRVGAVESLANRVAPLAARKISAVIKANCDAGQDPYGKPWPARKKDGGRALRNAADAVRVAALDKTVVMAVTGKEAIHDLGQAKGGIQRTILPEAGKPLPQNIRDAVHDSFEHVFSDIMEGR